jgi:hypothetical protein
LLDQEEVKRYDFSLLPDATPAQLALRQAWMNTL